jgi:predicted O-methyltransferase YrrM
MSIRQTFKSFHHRLIALLTLNGSKFNDFQYLNQSVLEVNNLAELKKIFNWDLDPILDIPIIYEFKYIEDLNERRLRDAEALGTTASNMKPMICVDIGTSQGHSAALIALNAPNSTVYTINILPEEIASGAGGILTTIALPVENIGSYYRQRGLKNIQQVYGNTASWEPNLGMIDLAFVDGSHDTKFVYNDTLKMLKRMKPGSFILWHDFNLELVAKYDWIYSVCLGVEQLYRNGYLKGRIFHLKDSWVGIYRVSEGLIDNTSYTK